MPLTITFVTCCVFFVVHLVIWHFELLKVRGSMLIVKISTLSYLFVSLTASYLSISFGNHFWVSFPLFLLFMMLYLYFYAGIVRTISIRILGELVKSTSGKITFREIQSLYPQEYLTKHRLDFLVKGNWLVEKNGAYACTNKGKNFAKLEILLKRLYSLKSTG